MMKSLGGERPNREVKGRRVGDLRMERMEETVGEVVVGRGVLRWW